MKKIIICICTYNRNQNLVNCLRSIENMELVNKFYLEVLILDNTVNFNSKSIIRKYKKKRLNKITIQNEKRRGIVFARNACLNFVRKNESEYVIFIDDDCVFDKSWLINAFGTLKKYNADVVTGPQEYRNKNGSVDNINFTQFFEKKYPINILKVSWAATNNVLLKSNIIKKSNLNFDINLNKFGMGEDQLFFQQLSKSGIKIFYSSKIKVTESIHNHRLNINWLKNRSFRLGVLGNYIDRKLYGNLIGTIINYLKFIYLLFNIFFIFFMPFKKNYRFILFNFYYRAIGKLYGPFIFKKINFSK